MKVGDLVEWIHEYSGERKILYVVEIIDEETIKCLFSYGAHQVMKKTRVRVFNDHKKTEEDLA